MDAGEAVDSADSIHPLIPVAEPVLAGNEQTYVLDCLQSGWISSAGGYITRFEKALAEAFSVSEALVCASGTAALHLTLAALGIRPGDEVIVPSLTFVASANAVRYLGATPVLVDCDDESWVMAPDRVGEAITARTRAIMPVHLFGHPAPMDELLAIARRYGLLVVEDAAEAHGARYKGQSVGGLGNAGILSFFGNKIITTGEGGAVLTNDTILADRIRLLRGHGQHPDRRYWFIEMGYNYRMSNLQAAVGLAQLERLDWLVARRRVVAGWYQELFANEFPELRWQIEQPWATSAKWMNSFVLPAEFPFSRDETVAALWDLGIETRPIFYPLHLLPPSLPARSWPCPTATSIAIQGLSLPSSSLLTQAQVEYVARSLTGLKVARPMRRRPVSSAGSRAAVKQAPAGTVEEYVRKGAAAN